jgi:YspA, cpYpsA-related SLOG family
MSEQFRLINRSRENEKSEPIDKFEIGNFKKEILKLGWSLSDRIIAKGNEGTKHAWKDELPKYEQIILITGCRDWKDGKMIKDALTQFSGKKVLLIHGDCRGADKLSGIAAKELGFSLSVKPADWDKYNKAAGPIRNKEMIKEALEYQTQGIPTLVLAFHDSLEESKGTLNCVNEAKKQGLKVILHSHPSTDKPKADVPSPEKPLTPLDVFKNKIYALWPWVKDVRSQPTKEDFNTFYENTYGFGDDDWTHRLIDGADDDELQRQVFTVLICLEFGFDGSSKHKPSLWRFWRKLHKDVVCPAFINKSAIKLHTEYIQWPVKTFKLEDGEGLMRALWHKVYDSTDSSAEERWIIDNFYSWAIYDMKQSGKDKCDNLDQKEPINHSEKESKLKVSRSRKPKTKKTADDE